MLKGRRSRKEDQIRKGRNICEGRRRKERMREERAGADGILLCETDIWKEGKREPDPHSLHQLRKHPQTCKTTL